MSDHQGAALLAAARGAIAEAFAKPAVALELESVLRLSTGAVFVTLRLNGRLRGCIGNLDAEAPLVESIRECARAAAFRDSRFAAVTADEFEQLSLEVSLLSPLREIRGPADVRMGVDGLMIDTGSSRGLLLPQVAVEYDADAERFLAMVCRKARLPEDAWATAKLYAFTVQRFCEPPSGLSAGGAG